MVDADRLTPPGVLASIHTRQDKTCNIIYRYAMYGHISDTLQLTFRLYNISAQNVYLQMYNVG